jgi:hypothetical protein
MHLEIVPLRTELRISYASTEKQKGHPERSEESRQLVLSSRIYEQLQRSFAALRMTDAHFVQILLQVL